MAIEKFTQKVAKIATLKGYKIHLKRELLALEQTLMKIKYVYIKSSDIAYDISNVFLMM